MTRSRCAGRSAASGCCSRSSSPPAAPAIATSWTPWSDGSHRDRTDVAADAATARQTSNGSSPKSDWDEGYGYQFWRCRHGAYRGDGAFGQYCVVMPEQDAVLVITSGVKDMQGILNLAWEILLPGLKSPTPLPTDDDAGRKLVQKLKGLTVRTPEGSGTPADAAFGRTFVFPPEEGKLDAITLEGAGSDGPVTVVARMNGVDRRITVGRGQWHKARLAWGRLPEQPAAASGAWTADDTFTFKLCFYETPFITTVKLRFADDELRYASETNVGFDSTKESEWVGRAK